MSYNKAMLAQLNKKIVLEMIRTQGPINKAEIARKAELSIPTVMKITEEFERENLVKTIGKGESTGGKRPDLLEFVSNAYYITGIDIGRHYVKIVIIDMAAVIMSKECFPTTEEDIKQPKQFLEKIAERVEALIIKSGISKGRFMGIGIGMPGILDYARGDVIFSPGRCIQVVPSCFHINPMASSRINFAPAFAYMTRISRTSASTSGHSKFRSIWSSLKVVHTCFSPSFV